MANPRSNRPKDTPLDQRKAAVEAQLAELRNKLNQHRDFLQKAPEMKAKAEKKRQEEIITNYRRPVRVEGSVDFRYDFVRNSETRKAPVLRKEKSKAPILTALLALLFIAVVYAIYRRLIVGG